MTTESWITKAAREILSGINFEYTLCPTEQEIASIIAAHAEPSVMNQEDKINKAMCYLCQAVDGKHTAECRATPENAVPLGEGCSWRAGVVATRKVIVEICICAAVKMGALIIRGHRHDDCLRNIIARRLDSEPIEQGFITSQNRFVSRKEAMQLQREAGMKSVCSPNGELQGDILFSEDLY